MENNGLFRQAVREGLQLSFPGVAIEEATNGVEALQRVKAFLPDLILMDIRLPGESGPGLSQKIKSAYPDIIIFIVPIMTHQSTGKLLFDMGLTISLPRNLSIGCGLKNW